MRKRMNTERLDRLVNDTRVLSEVVDQLLIELTTGSSPIHRPKTRKVRKIDNRIAHLFERDEG